MKEVVHLLKADNITLGKSLGRGGQAYVFYAKYQSNTMNDEVAVKVCSSEKRDLTRELKNMIGLKHRNVIKFLDFWRKKPIKFIVFEYAEGDMRSCLQRHKSQRLKCCPALTE